MDTNNKEDDMAELAAGYAPRMGDGITEGTYRPTDGVNNG